MRAEMKNITLVGLTLVVLVSAVSGNGIDQGALKDEQVSQRSKFLTMPNNLARFLLSNVIPYERQVGGPIGYKRSSSALDALTGMTLGKRSAPVEFINMEPLLSRQLGIRSMPRMYDLRWAPLDAYESSLGSDSN